MVSSLSMHKLTQAIQQLSYSRDIPTLQTLITSCAREISSADGATLILREGDYTYYAEENSIAPLWKGLRLASDMCIGGWSMRHKKVAVVSDIHDDPRISQSMYAETFVRSLLITPVRTTDPIAAIGVYWANPRTATAEEIEQLQILANCTAVSLENVELMTKLNTRIMERTSSLLISQQMAETANKTKTRFLSAASHDLRQPLQSLSTLCSILSRKLSDSELAKHVAKMQSTIGGMNQLLNAILDLNQLESGGLTPDFRNFPLESLLDHLRAEFTDVATAKSLQLHIPTAKIQLHSDPDMLLQILRNLLGNAIKYTQTGQVSLQSVKTDQTVIISISDTGLGIPEEKQEEIFDAFYRMERDRAKKGGFGLGLAIVKGLAEILNHQVNVMSATDEGAVFSIQIPATEDEHSNIIESGEPVLITDSGPKATLLYLEDDEDIIEAIETLLSIEGYQVITAESGEKAVSILHDQLDLPDLIITDSRLVASESGVEVVQRLRRLANRNIPAIMLTGYTEKSVRNEALETVQKVLSKPVDADLLLAEIAAVLEY